MGTTLKNIPVSSISAQDRFALSTHFEVLDSLAVEHYKNKSLENLTDCVPYSELISDPNCTDTHLVQIFEEWKTIPGFPNFLASSFGRIRALYRQSLRKDKGVMVSKPEKILSQILDKRGYPRVNIAYQSRLVHRLIGLAFHDNFEDKRTINHIKPIKTRNFSFNLEWTTDKENKKHAMDNGLAVICKNGFGKEHPNSKVVEQLNLDGSLVKIWDSTADTQRNGYNECCVRNVCKGRQLQHKGFIWRYTS